MSTPAMTPTPEITAEEIPLLKGEGDVKLTLSTRCRRECQECGEPATKRMAFLLEGTRSNPASSAYGRDDCSWCSDMEAFSCDKHTRAVEAPPSGYVWCSTFHGERHSHMLLYWNSVEVTRDSPKWRIDAALASIAPKPTPQPEAANE